MFTRKDLKMKKTFLCKVLQAFQAKALEVNEKINAVVEFLEDALARAKYLVTFSRLVSVQLEGDPMEPSTKSKTDISYSSAYQLLAQLSCCAQQSLPVINFLPHYFQQCLSKILGYTPQGQERPSPWHSNQFKSECNLSPKALA